MRRLVVVGVAVLACGEPPVEPPPEPEPVGLVVTASDTMQVTGATLTFSAVAVDSAGAVVADVPIAWSVGDPQRGRITAAGVFTGGPDSGQVYVRAVVEDPALAESVAVRVVLPGTVKWIWAAGALGQLVLFGGPALGTDGTAHVLLWTRGWPDWLATLVALTPNGAVRWSRELQPVANTNYPIVTPEGDILLVGQDVHLLRPDGSSRWRVATDAGSPGLNSGAVTDDLVIVALGYHLTAFRLANGDTAWQSQLAPAASWLVPPTAVRTTLVYAKRTSDTLFAFRQSDGTILHTYLDPDTSVDKSVFGRGTVPVGDRFYLPTVHRLAAFDTAGPLLWLTDETQPGMSEPAVGPDGVLYVQNGRWGLQAVNPDGTTRWYRRSPLWRDGVGYGWDTQPKWHGGPALAQGGVIYAAGQGGVFAYDASGVLLWSYVADSAGTWQPFLGLPAVAPDGTVYSYTSTHVYAFWASAPPEPNSPWPMWRHDAQRTGWAR